MPPSSRVLLIVLITVVGGWLNGVDMRSLSSTRDGSTPNDSLAIDSSPSSKGAGYWRPMDTMRERRALEEDWASGKPPWKVW